MLVLADRGAGSPWAFRRAPQKSPTLVSTFQVTFSHPCSALKISLGLRPQEISRVSGNLLGVGDGFPNTSLVLVEHGYNHDDDDDDYHPCTMGSSS